LKNRKIEDRKMGTSGANGRAATRAENGEEGKIIGEKPSAPFAQEIFAKMSDSDRLQRKEHKDFTAEPPSPESCLSRDGFIEQRRELVPG